MSRALPLFAAGLALAIGGALAFLGASIAIGHYDDVRLLGLGLALLLPGLAAIAWAVGALRAGLLAGSPEQTAIRILNLARASGGTLTMADIMETLRLSPQAAARGLERLLADDVCRRERRDDTDYYVFPACM